MNMKAIKRIMEGMCGHQQRIKNGIQHFTNVKHVEKSYKLEKDPSIKIP